MIDINKNELINSQLDNLYKNHTTDFLSEWKKAFKEPSPFRINEFGIIDTQKYDSSEGILFICRETNNWDDKDFEKGCLFRKWMYEITKNGFSAGSHISKHPNMWYNIGRWITLIQNPQHSIDDISSLKKEAIHSISNIAFTNINKVRGKNSSKKEYNALQKTDIVGKLLQKELEIINPKIVVCCGTGKTFDFHIKNYDGKVIYMPHPAARINVNNLLMNLKSQL